MGFAVVIVFGIVWCYPEIFGFVLQKVQIMYLNGFFYVKDLFNGAGKSEEI